jgi:hypothetical protein
VHPWRNYSVKPSNSYRNGGEHTGVNASSTEQLVAELTAQRIRRLEVPLGATARRRRDLATEEVFVSRRWWRGEVVAGGSGGEIWRRRDLAAARSTAPSVKLRRDSSFAAAAAAARVRNASPSSRLGNPSTRRVCASFLGLTRLYTGLPNGL